MIRMIFFAFLTITCIQKGNAIKVDCNESEFNAYKDWDCSLIEYYFTPEKVRQTLYCIDYNKIHAPKALNYTEPTTLNLARNIVKFHDVIEDSKEITFKESFLFDYLDARLAFPNCNPNFMLEYDVKDMYSFLWFPKFQSAFSTIDATPASATSQGSTIRFWPNSGRLAIISTITATVICTSYDDTKMNFKHFPFDYHNCSIPIRLDYEKYYRDGSINVRFNLFEHSDEIKLEHPDWKLGFSQHKIIIKDITMAKRDKVLSVPVSIYSITLQREITSYYFHTFMPSLFLCLACTLSNFIHYDNMPARMSLVTSSCLSLITLFSGAK